MKKQLLSILLLAEIVCHAQGSLLLLGAGGAAGEHAYPDLLAQRINRNYGRGNLHHCHLRLQLIQRAIYSWPQPG